MDERKKEKIRRIYALAGAILFVLLIVNIVTIQFQLAVSLGIYIFIVMFYLFFLRKRNDGKTDFTVNEEKKNDPDKDSE